MPFRKWHPFSVCLMKMWQKAKEVLKTEKEPYVLYCAIDEIESHCTAEQLKGLKKVVDGLKDDKADLIQSHYQGKFK